jgi:hypothetical protein
MTTIELRTGAELTTKHLSSNWLMNVHPLIKRSYPINNRFCLKRKWCCPLCGMGQQAELGTDTPGIWVDQWYNLLAPNWSCLIRWTLVPSQLRATGTGHSHRYCVFSWGRRTHFRKLRLPAHISMSICLSVYLTVYPISLIHQPSIYIHLYISLCTQSISLYNFYICIYLCMYLYMFIYFSAYPFI